MDQRWPDISSLLSVQNGTDHYSHPTHAYPGHGISHHHSHYDNQRNVLLHNATLAPPVGDLNSTGPYHSVGKSNYHFKIFKLISISIIIKYLNCLI